MKKIYLVLACLALASLAAAQTEINAVTSTGCGYSVTAVTDYECLGINPANLGWRAGKSNTTLGFLEFAGSIYSEPLTKKQVTHDLFSTSFKLNLNQKEDAADLFTDKRFWSQAAMTWVGFSYQNKTVGGFAFSVRDRGMWSTVFNHQASRFTFLGYHDPYFDSLAVVNGDTTGYSTNPGLASVLYGSSKLQFIWYREYNLGYGRQFIENETFSLYGGIGLKFLTGYGSFQYYEDGGGIHAYTSLSPVFNVNYNRPTPSAVSGNGLKKVGTGFGIDIGATALILEKLKVALAINDIGSLNWNGNVYRGNEALIYQITTGGIDDYNLFAQGQLINADDKPNAPGFFEGISSKKLGLPTTFRGGAGFRFDPKVEVGADLMVPVKKNVPGYYEKSIIGLGVKYSPAKWVDLSAGLVSGNNFGTNIPFGITFNSGKGESEGWQCGFAVRDVITWFRKDNPTMSFAFGFLRFSFGKAEK